MVRYEHGNFPAILSFQRRPLPAVSASVAVMLGACVFATAPKEPLHPQRRTHAAGARFESPSGRYRRATVSRFARLRRV